jgi:hypothetical protein
LFFISPLPMYAACPFHVLLVDLFIQITCGEEYKFWSSCVLLSSTSCFFLSLGSKYKTAGIILYNLIFCFRHETEKWILDWVMINIPRI